MKAILVTSVVIFIASITFRLLHWPFASFFMIAVVSILFIFALLNSFAKKKIFHISVLGGWLLFSWSVYILFRYLYWYAGPSIFGFNSMFLVVFGLTVFYLIRTFQSPALKFSKVVLFVSAFGFIFSFVPSYSTYYFFMLNHTFNQESRQVDYLSWDKYSWFLYIRGEKARALEANAMAMKAFEKRSEMDYQSDAYYETMKALLNDNRAEIIDENWTSGALLARYKRQ